MNMVGMMFTKPVSCIAQPPRLRVQLRGVIRCKHYSLRSEETYPALGR